MKSEAEIRKYRADLRRCIAMPCDCAGAEHEVRCSIGAKIMEAIEDALSWCLDEGTGRMDGLVERTAARASEP